MDKTKPAGKPKTSTLGKPTQSSGTSGHGFHMQTYTCGKVSMGKWVKGKIK